MTMDVNVDFDSVTIYEDGKEIVKWLKDEWQEDETVLFAIFNAIKFAYSNPEHLKNLLHIN